MRRRGHAVVELDILKGEYCNLLNPMIARTVEQWIINGWVSAIFVATPCESMSRARRAPLWSRMPHQLRSAAHPSGIPQLEGRDLETLQRGNRLSRIASKFIKLAEENNVMGFEENPASSYLWDLHDRPRRAKHPSFHTHAFEQCAFGTPYRKRTRIDSWHVSLPLAPSCSSKLCKYTGQRHQVLSGIHNKGGEFCTKGAAAYPSKMCNRLAATIHAALANQVASRIWKVFQC